MPVFAVVPVQRLASAKTRLSSTLSLDERKHLVIKLLDNVLSALSDSERVDQIVVVSPDQAVMERSRHRGAVALQQPGSGLNEAIRQGRDYAVGQGADAVLVLLADLPRLTAGEIDDLLATSESVSVTVGPDRHGHGTNALVLRPPDAIEPFFGVDSFQAHRAAASRLSRSFAVFNSAGTAFDVDTREDLTDLGWMDDPDFSLRDAVQRTPIFSSTWKLTPSGDQE